jgi:hypothetical protein
VKDALEERLGHSKFAATQARLHRYFPETSPVNFWIRASMTLASVHSAAAISQADFELSGKAYAQVLAGEESAVASLQSGLRTLPQSERGLRQQAFRMLSDIGLTNPPLRNAVRDVLLSEAARAGSHPDGAIAYASLLRMNPTQEWFQAVSRSYSRLHPGSELSDFVSLNVANL